MGLLGILAAAACAHSCKPSADHYYFEQDSVRIERTIRVVTYQSYKELFSAYREHATLREERIYRSRNGRASNVSLQAFSIIGDKVCTIHMIDPKVHYEPEFFGHELTHCLYGEFHPHQSYSE